MKILSIGNRGKNVSQDKYNMRHVHVDQNDTQRPHIGGAGLIHGSHIVHALCETKHRDQTWEEEPKEEETTIAHIRRTTTIHVRRDSIPSGEPKVTEFDDDLAFANPFVVEDPAISNDEALRLDVTMKDGSIMAGGYSLAHLGKHRGDKAETGRR
jgi:hypothetical protein